MKKRKTGVARHSGKSADRDAAIRLVIRQEKLVWKAAQERNAEEFSKLVPFDAVMIFQSGIVRQPEYLATMMARTVSHSEIRDYAWIHAEFEHSDSDLPDRAHWKLRRERILVGAGDREYNVDQAGQTLGCGAESRDACNAVIPQNATSCLLLRERL